MVVYTQIALLEKRKEIQKRHARFATVYEWIRTIQEKYLEGEKITSIDVTTLKLLVEKIIVKSNGIEVRFNCGVEISKEFTE